MISDEAQILNPRSGRRVVAFPDAPASEGR